MRGPIPISKLIPAPAKLPLSCFPDAFCETTPTKIPLQMLSIQRCHIHENTLPMPSQRTCLRRSQMHPSWLCWLRVRLWGCVGGSRFGSALSFSVFHNGCNLWDQQVRSTLQFEAAQVQIGDDHAFGGKGMAATISAGTPQRNASAMTTAHSRCP